MTRDGTGASQPGGIRKPIYELTPSDLAEYPIWEFALDEEDVEGQDEMTVRPLPEQEFAYNADVARATIIAADGTEFIGFVTPDPDRDLGRLQPTIVTDRGQVNFWFGWQEGGITDEMVEPLYDLLRKSADQLFPITYRLDVPWHDGSKIRTLEGEVTGFGWLAGLGGEDTRERR